MDQVGSVEIVIKGGRPWGFTLQGGIESRSALTVAQIEPDGKAEHQGGLRIGDHILKINDVQCVSLADATQLIDCAFRTLTVLVWRSKSIASLPSVQEENMQNDILHDRRLFREDKLERKTSTRDFTRVLPNDHASPVDSTPTTDTGQTSKAICDSNLCLRSYTESPVMKYPFEGSFVHPSCQSSLLDRSCSALTLDSDQGAFQTDESHNRYFRSPRNLTKDSGYETSAQTEHDYVNVEWINNCQASEKTLYGSLADHLVPKKNGSNRDYVPVYPGMYKYFPSSVVEEMNKSPHNTTVHPEKSKSSLPYSIDYKESNTSFVPDQYKKRTDSYNSLYSSSESLSSRSSKVGVNQIRPAKSSPSLMDKTGNLKARSPEIQQVITSCQNFSHGVSPAQSVPSLQSKAETFPQTTNRKQSVYEALACKCGFDFSPLRHCSSFSERKQKFEINALSDSQDNKNSLTYACNIKSTPSKSIFQNTESNYACANRDKQKTDSFSAKAKSDDDSVSRNDKSPNSPPPLPPRASSLRLLSNHTHEKSPSWPVSAPLESSTLTSGLRSKSWTEQTEESQNSNSANSRPEKKYEILTQHLPPVREKVKKVHENRKFCPIALVEPTFSSYEYIKPFSVDRNSNVPRNSYKFDHIYENTDEVFNSTEMNYELYSPPERDLSFSFNKINTIDLADAAHEHTPMESRNPENCELYENLRFPATPMLDPQILEKKKKSYLSQSSNNGSQETLHWYGSYSDLSSAHTGTRKYFSSFGSDTSNIYEEIKSLSPDGSVSSYATLRNSPLDISVESNETYERNHWQDTPTDMSSSSNKESAIFPNNSAVPPKTPIFSASKTSMHLTPDNSEISENKRDNSFSPGSYDNSDNSFDSGITCNKFEKRVSKIRESYESRINPSQRENISNSHSNRPERSLSFSRALKAIQKQAVLSFFHRQNAKISGGKESPRSSSFTQVNNNAVSAIAVQSVEKCDEKRQMKMYTNPFLQLRPDCSNNVNDVVKINTSSSNNSNCGNYLALDSASAPCSLAIDEYNENDSLQNAMIALKQNDELGKMKLTPNSSAMFDKEDESGTETEQNVNTNHSEWNLKVPLTARKVYVKTTSKPNKNVIVEVVPTEAAKPNHNVKFQDLSTTKPQIPPKRISVKLSPVVPQQFNSLPALQAPSDINEDEELTETQRDICNNSNILEEHCDIMASSPELPLPSPPPLANIYTDIALTDEPLPPPPNPQEFFSLENTNIAQYISNEIESHSPILRNKFSGFEDTSKAGIIRINMDAHKFRDSFQETSPCAIEYSHIPSSENSNPTIDAVSDNEEKQVVNYMEKESACEAVYVNVYSRKTLRDNFNVNNMPQIHSAISSNAVKNYATQTTPSLQRKHSYLKSYHRIKKLECNLVDYTKFGTSNSYISEVPNGKSNNSCIRETKQTISPCTTTNSSASVVGMDKNSIASNNVQLPPSNPYFTTSEPKAKLLTRYNHILNEDVSDQLELRIKKEKLIASLSRKLNVLRLEQIELRKESLQNEELGQEVTEKIEKVAKPNEIAKYKVHVEELEKIINLLLSLSGRLARTEHALSMLPEKANIEEKKILEAKRDKLIQQQEEAWLLNENIDRRSSQVSKFLHQYLSMKDFADYQHFIEMKSKLLMDTREIDEKIKLGEEQIISLQNTLLTVYPTEEVQNNVSGELTVLDNS